RPDARLGLRTFDLWCDEAKTQEQRLVTSSSQDIGRVAFSSAILSYQIRMKSYGIDFLGEVATPPNLPTFVSIHPNLVSDGRAALCLLQHCQPRTGRNDHIQRHKQPGDQPTRIK